MSTQSCERQVPPLVVAQCQEEIQQIMASLRELSDAMEMESWSLPIRQTYHLALDDLAALEIYLHLFQTSLPQERQGEGRKPDGASPES